MNDQNRNLNLFRLYEERAKEKGFSLIAGIDEAGRGPLAGPVVAAACILPSHHSIRGIDDSKKLSSSRRKDLFNQLIAHPDVLQAVGVVEADRIDKMNILQATFHAMILAVMNLPIQPEYLLIDGHMAPDFKIPCETIIGGDARSESIAAASIIAKQTRDDIMRVHHETWPCYNFAKHKGYPTKEHLSALLIHGPCPLHRRSFDPVKKVIN